MVSQYQANHYYIVVGAWQDGRSGHVMSSLYTRTTYPQAISLHQLTTIIECRQGCAQESTCITGGSYFSLVPPSHPPPLPPSNIIILLFITAQQL